MTHEERTMLVETLTEEEARVLGTLVEKSLATPDYYPMTLNALRNACNQKSSRDPVTAYEEGIVSLALSGLKRKCLVTFIPYGSQGNTFKYRHFLEDVRFNLRKQDLAALAVLLLRGSQTLNEVRMRASSLHPMEDLGAAEAALKALADRSEPLAELLPKRPGWKEPRWRDTVRVHDESKAGGSGSGEDAGDATDAEAGGPSDKDVIAALQREVADLKAEFASLREVVERIRTELGA